MATVVKEICSHIALACSSAVELLTSPVPFSQAVMAESLMKL
ncbi:hypothetical protein ACFL4C_04350 [Candidatus Omnitrophota bacterium]